MGTTDWDAMMKRQPTTFPLVRLADPQHLSLPPLPAFGEQSVSQEQCLQLLITIFHFYLFGRFGVLSGPKHPQKVSCYKRGCCDYPGTKDVLIILIFIYHLCCYFYQLLTSLKNEFGVILLKRHF